MWKKIKMIKSVVKNIDNSKFKINVEVLELFKKYVQKDTTSFESGGVIIGKENRSNNNIIITSATQPMSQDIQTHSSYYRKDGGHINFFIKLYELQEGTVRYYGEWHSHPEAYPHYSLIDLKNWKRIKSEGPEKSDYYHIIVGYMAIRIWKIGKETTSPMLVTTIKWKDILVEKNI